MRILRKQRWSNDKTIIELNYRKISRFVCVSQIAICCNSTIVYYIFQPVKTVVWKSKARSFQTVRDGFFIHYGRGGGVNVNRKNFVVAVWTCTVEIPGSVVVDNKAGIPVLLNRVSLTVLR